MRTSPYPFRCENLFCCLARHHAGKCLESGRPRQPKRKARAPLNPVSKSPTSKEAIKEYNRVKRIWRAKSDGRCEMIVTRTQVLDGAIWTLLVPVPTSRLQPSSGSHFRCPRTAAPSPHHLKRRGKYLSDIGTFMQVCFEHHTWIHQHEEQARRLGYLLDRPAKVRP